MYCVCKHEKEPQEPPEHTSEHVKSQNFLGVCPQTPPHIIHFVGPHFLYSPPSPLSSPEKVQHLQADWMPFQSTLLHGFEHQKCVHSNSEDKMWICRIQQS